MRLLWVLGLFPVLVFAQTDGMTSTTVPAAPSAGQQEVLNACLQDMPHRVGVWQTHGDLVCGCMFTGPNAWRPDGDPTFTEKKYYLLANIIRAGGLNDGLRNAALTDRLIPADINKLERFGRVYPAMLFQNKSVVQCFNDKCRATGDCEVRMNDVSGTAPGK